MFKYTLVLLAIFALANCHFLRSENGAMGEFIKFIKQNNREYSTVDEFETRFAVFSENIKNLEENVSTYSSVMDLTPEEFEARLNLDHQAYALSVSKMDRLEITIKVEDLPESFDWADKGAVTPVKDQGQCGSCWAFSAIANLESQYAIKTGEQIDLSEQQVVDCDKQSQGCNGGWMNNAFEYVKSKGLALTSEYPYKAKGQKCNDSAIHAKVYVASYLNVDQNEAAMQAALMQSGPLSIAINASQFQFYNGGIFNKTCSTQLNHGVTLTGWGVENGVKFWKIKNSWGKGWGEKGYIRVVRGKAICGLNLAVSTATLK